MGQIVRIGLKNHTKDVSAVGCGLCIAETIRGVNTPNHLPLYTAAVNPSLLNSFPFCVCAVAKLKQGKGPYQVTFSYIYSHMAFSVKGKTAIITGAGSGRF